MKQKSPSEPFFVASTECSNTPNGLQKRGWQKLLQPLIDRVQSQYEPHRELRRAHILEGIEGLIFMSIPTQTPPYHRRYLFQSSNNHDTITCSRQCYRCSGCHDRTSRHATTNSGPTAATDATAAPPAVPAVPAVAANAAPVVPAVADIMVAAEAPQTADAVDAAVPVAIALSPPATVEAFTKFICLTHIVLMFELVLGFSSCLTC